jgi:hypothetical protein
MHPELALTSDALDMPHTVTFGPDGTIWIPCYNDPVLGFDGHDIQRAVPTPR